MASCGRGGGGETSGGGHPCRWCERRLFTPSAVNRWDECGAFMRGHWESIAFKVFDAPSAAGGLLERLDAARRALAGFPTARVQAGALEIASRSPRDCRRLPGDAPGDQPNIARSPEVEIVRRSPEVSRRLPEISGGGARAGGLGGAVRGRGGGGEAADARRGSRRRGPHPAGLEAGTAGPLLVAGGSFLLAVFLCLGRASGPAGRRGCSR